MPRPPHRTTSRSATANRPPLHRRAATGSTTPNDRPDDVAGSWARTPSGPSGRRRSSQNRRAHSHQPYSRNASNRRQRRQRPRRPRLEPRPALTLPGRRSLRPAVYRATPALRPPTTGPEFSREPRHRATRPQQRSTIARWLSIHPRRCPRSDPLYWSSPSRLQWSPLRSTQSSSCGGLGDGGASDAEPSDGPDPPRERAGAPTTPPTKQARRPATLTHGARLQRGGITATPSTSMPCTEPHTATHAMTSAQSLSALRVAMRTTRRTATHPIASAVAARRDVEFRAPAARNSSPTRWRGWRDEPFRRQIGRNRRPCRPPKVINTYGKTRQNLAAPWGNQGLAMKSLSNGTSAPRCC